MVSNCTVSNNLPDQKPYKIIDERGCTKEPSLFEHVEVLFLKKKNLITK